MLNEGIFTEQESTAFTPPSDLDLSFTQRYQDHGRGNAV